MKPVLCHDFYMFTIPLCRAHSVLQIGVSIVFLSKAIELYNDEKMAVKEKQTYFNII